MKLRITLPAVVLVVLGVAASPALALRPIPSYTAEVLSPPIAEAGAEFGEHMDSLGDVNGDGVSDFAVSSRLASFGAQQRLGRVWVFSGRTRGLLFSMFPPGGDRQSDGGFGSSVIGIGDVDGDGVPDMAIGSSGLDVSQTADPVTGKFNACSPPATGCNENQGRVYIYSGSGDTNNDPSSGRVIRVVDAPTRQAHAFFGDDQAVGTRDLNNDGVNDFVESASGENVGLCDANFDGTLVPCPVGAAYTISGATGSVIHRLDDPDPQPFASFAQGGVSNPGDVTGDGVDDVVMGAPFSDRGGHIYLFDGRAGGPAKLALEDPEDPNGGAGFGFGRGTGREPHDVNGDGVGELYAVDPGQTVGPVTNAGRAYLLSGVNGALVQILDDPNPKPSGSFAFYHASAGDLNGDGTPDVLAMRFTFTANAYAPDPVPGAEASVLDGRTGAALVSALPGVTRDGPARSLASPGDINGDGYPDYLLGGRVSDGTVGDLTGRVVVELSGPPAAAPLAAILPPATPPADAPPATTAVRDTVKPVLRGLLITPRAFRAARSGGSVVTRGGSKVSYTLSEKASVRFGVERAVSGRRVGGRCLGATAARRHAKRCTRYVVVSGSFTQAGHAGKNALRFSGRLARRTLHAGVYRLNARATDAAGNRSALKRSAGFRIKR